MAARELILQHFDDICKETAATTIGLKHILAPYNIPRTTFIDFLNDANNKEFSDRYARAKEIQIDTLAEEIMDIADDGSNDLMTIVKGNEAYEQENKEVTTRSRLRVDTRKWLLSKLAPKKFGDRLDITSNEQTIKQAIIIGGQQIDL